MALVLTHIAITASGVQTKVAKKAYHKVHDMPGHNPFQKDASGQRSSIRQEYKGVNKVAGFVGKGKPKDRSTEDARNHNSAPLTTLQDPSAFGPPPVHVNRAPVLSNGPKPTYTKAYGTVGRNSFPESKVLSSAPKGGGWGSALSTDSVRQIEAPYEEEENKPKPPPVPYRADTTGINTANLPKPPAFRGDVLHDDYAPPAPAPRLAITQGPGARPTPPPRLPARQNSQPNEYTPPAPPPYTHTSQPEPQPQSQPSYLNQSSLNRLGQSGISVPAFGINNRSASPEPQDSPAAIQQTSGAQLSELQSRFNKMPGRLTSPTSTSQSTAPSTGTTWAQKQSALTTASKFQKDPSSISLSEAREAGSTINNFRQRHGDQVAVGYQKAQGMDQKYGISGRVGGYANGMANGGGIGGIGRGQAQAQEEQPIATPPQPSYQQPPTAATGIAGKKPPPPPPKKKELTAAPGSGPAPPPVPLGSKPRG